MEINETLVYVMAGAVIVSALALLLQAVVLTIAARTVKSRLDELTPKAESLMETAERTLQQSKKQIEDITTKANTVMDTASKQVQKTDDFLSETTDRARVQLDRLEMVLDDTISRVHETVIMLNKGVLIPIREVTGITNGVRSAISFLMRGRRPSVDRATTDEEMFI